VAAQATDDTKNIETTPVKVEEEEEEEEVEIFTVVENDPEFPGGTEALYKYLATNIKFPQLARDNNISGRVYVTFVVERDGSITGARVLRDIGGGCGAEAIRVVKAMPKWTPGKQRGKPVRVQYNLPVAFILQ
jgi:protein TonB